MTKSTLSPIVAGTMNWGIWNKKFSTSAFISRMETCIDNQITSFDHADIYGAYTTEADFGKAFFESKIGRNQIQLISKCGIQSISDNRQTSIKHYDYSKKHIIWSVENSLKNLQTDYLDLLLLHRPSPLIIVDEVANAINQLQAEGKILDFGLSNFTNTQTQLLQKELKISYNQVQFSATHLDPMLDGSFDFMQNNSIRPMAWNPLGSFFKLDDEKSARLKEVVAVLSQKYNVGADIILLSWIIKHPAKVVPVVGTADLNRIQSLIQATKINLNTEEWFGIWAASIGKNVP